nr:hypothetical protein [uncultured Aminipila sp.]
MKNNKFKLNDFILTIIFLVFIVIFFNFFYPFSKDEILKSKNIENIPELKNQSFEVNKVNSKFCNGGAVLNYSISIRNEKKNLIVIYEKLPGFNMFKKESNFITNKGVNTAFSNYLGRSYLVKIKHNLIYIKDCGYEKDNILTPINSMIIIFIGINAAYLIKKIKT